MVSINIQYCIYYFITMQHLSPFCNCTCWFTTAIEFIVTTRIATMIKLNASFIVVCILKEWSVKRSDVGCTVCLLASWINWNLHNEIRNSTATSLSVSSATSYICSLLLLLLLNPYYLLILNLLSTNSPSSLKRLCINPRVWRRGWDSNPRVPKDIS